MSRAGDLLVVLMRWPAEGRGKSRLAAGLGAEPAHRLHLGFVGDTLRWSAAWPRMIAFTPAEARPHVALAAPGAALAPQPDGDLGTRLGHAVASGFAAGAERVLLIGSDSPTLPETLMEPCLAAARPGTISMVAALDGGFIAMAVSRTDAGRLPAILAGVEWSTSRTCAGVTRRARALDMEARLVGAWYDVDEPADLERLAADVARQPERTPSTAEALARLGLLVPTAWPPGS